MDVSTRLGTILYALLIATVLQLVPAYGGWVDWKPNFILVIVIVLMINQPDQFSVIFAATVGLFADGVFGTTVGHFMLVFTLCGTLLVLPAFHAGIYPVWNPFGVTQPMDPLFCAALSPFGGIWCEFICDFYANRFD